MSSVLSRRALVEGALGIAAVASRPLASAGQELSEAEKIPHADALYQLSPKGQQRCAICLQFEAPDHCKIVQSPIYPGGWCQFFAARENAR